MNQVTANVYVESDYMVCNLGFITTRDGIVMIDTPTSPTNAVKWREEISKHGDIRYIINTEEHPDHCTNSCFFPGILITSQETRDMLAKQPIEDTIALIRRTEPNGSSLIDSYYLRLADITFNGTMNLYLGDHTFILLPLPGHCPSVIGVYIPEEKVIFSSDCVFHQVKSWFGDSTPEQWLNSLQTIGNLDVDAIIPGHGTVCNKDYLKEQTSIVQGWVQAVQSAIKRGLTKEEAESQIISPDPYPVQSGVARSAEALNKMGIDRLYQLYHK